MEDPVGNQELTGGETAKKGVIYDCFEGQIRSIFLL